MQKKRPKHLDLGKISLPIMAKVSILHRISGVALFLALPLLIYRSVAAVNFNKQKSTRTLFVKNRVRVRTVWWTVQDSNL